MRLSRYCTDSTEIFRVLLGGHSLALLADEALVDVWDDSTSGNGEEINKTRFSSGKNAQEILFQFSDLNKLDHTNIKLISKEF